MQKKVYLGCCLHIWHGSYGVKSVSVFMDWGDEAFVPNVGNIPELRMILKSLRMANLNLCSVYFIISFRNAIDTTGFLGFQGLYLCLIVQLV